MSCWEVEQSIRAVKQGNRHAFEGIVHTYQAKIYRYVRYITPNKFDVDDIVQDIFIRVFTQLYQYREGTNFEAWLYRIANTQTMTTLRKMSRSKMVLFREVPEGMHYDEYGVEASTTILRAMSMLKPDERSILYLRVYEALTYKEISAILKQRESVLRKRYERAKSKFAKYYLEVEKSEESDLRSVN